MITSTALLPAVCATRANFHAGRHLVLNDLHTGRVRGLLIEIATSPPDGKNDPSDHEHRRRAGKDSDRIARQEWETDRLARFVTPDKMALLAPFLHHRHHV